MHNVSAGIEYAPGRGTTGGKKKKEQDRHLILISIGNDGKTYMMQSILWCKMKGLGTKKKFPIFPAAEVPAKILLLGWGGNAVFRVPPGGVPIISLNCLALLVTRMGGRLVPMYGWREGKQTSPETVKNRWCQTCSRSKTGRSFKASWWGDVHAGYLVTGFCFFLCIFWQIDSRNHGFRVFYFFFPLLANDTRLLSRISQLPGPRATCRGDRLAFYLLRHLYRWLSKQAGFIFSLRKPRPTLIHLLKSMHFLDFIRIFFWMGGG